MRLIVEWPRHGTYTVGLLRVVLRRKQISEDTSMKERAVFRYVYSLEIGILPRRVHYIKQQMHSRNDNDINNNKLNYDNSITYNLSPQ